MEEDGGVGGGVGGGKAACTREKLIRKEEIIDQSLTETGALI